MQRVFITGIAGFLGYHLAKHLSTQGYYVAGCDLLQTEGSVKALRVKELQVLDVHLFDLDCSNIEKLKDEFDRQPFDHFVHFAYKYSRIATNEDRVDASIDAIGILTRILEFVCSYQPMKFILASSSAVYESGSNTVVAPESFYGALKVACEGIATSYHKSYGLDVTILRLYTIYGPLGRPDMNYFSFTKTIAENKTLVLHSQKHAARDFLYIDDALDAITNSLTLRDLHIINIGSGQTYTKERLIDELQAILHKKNNIEYRPNRFHVLDEAGADLSAAQQLLQFFPKTSLNTGLHRFVTWYTTYHSEHCK
jgi:UDP-glucuronate 4-epimerase